MWQRYCHLYTVVLTVDIIKHAEIAIWKGWAANIKKYKFKFFLPFFSSYTPIDCCSLAAQHLHSRHSISILHFPPSVHLWMSPHPGTLPRGEARKGRAQTFPRGMILLTVCCLWDFKNNFSPSDTNDRLLPKLIRTPHHEWISSTDCLLPTPSAHFDRSGNWGA